MKTTVILTNNFDSSSVELKNKICLIIDILRTTSAIISILGSGADKIIISPSLNRAFQLKKHFKDYILCGEHMALKPNGFDCEILPYHISKLNFKGKSIILKTTNGTRSYIKAQDAKMVLTLSLLNINYTLDLAVKYANKLNVDLLFLCSGVLKDIAYDDAFAAGLAINYLLKKVDNIELDDSSELVLNAALNENDVYKALKKTRSGKWTLDLGLKDELVYSSQLNKLNITGKLEIDTSNKELGKLFILRPF
ncbi:MAG: 2-phosphosulfolactate phosphatase [Actinobacteria bacterium]|nr:2-phosphosulfolactate phosphatase [Actinomycetota bacterium]